MKTTLMKQKRGLISLGAESNKLLKHGAKEKTPVEPQWAMQQTRGSGSNQLE